MPDFIELILIARDKASDVLDKAADRMEQSSKKAEAAVSHLGDAVDQTGSKMDSATLSAGHASDSIDQLGESHDRASKKARDHGDAVEDLDLKSKSLGSSIERLLSTIGKSVGIHRDHEEASKRSSTANMAMAVSLGNVLSKISMLLTVLPLLTVAITGLSGIVTTLTGGVMALVGALSTLSGLVVALPAGLMAVAGAMTAVMTIIAPGIKGIVEGYKAIDKQQQQAGASAKKMAADIKQATEEIARAKKDAARQEAEDIARLKRLGIEGVQDLKDAIQRLKDFRENAVEKLTRMEERLALMRVHNVEKIGDDEKALAQYKLDSAERLIKAEQDLMSLRKQNADQEKQLQSVVTEARANLAGAQMTGVGTNLAKANLSEAERDLVAFQERARMNEQTAAQKITDIRVESAQRILDMETQLRREKRDAAIEEKHLAEDIKRFKADAVKEELAQIRNVKDTRTRAIRAIREAETRLAIDRENATRRLKDLQKQLAEATNPTTGGIAAQAAVLAKLSPLQIQIANEIRDIRDRWKELTAVFKDRALFMVQDAITLLDQKLPSVATKVGAFSDALVGVGGDAIAKAKDKEFTAALGRDADTGAQTVGRLGRAVVALGGAVVYLVDAGRPMIDWLTRAIELWAKSTEETVKLKNETGQLGTFFDHTQQTASTLWGMLTNLFGALKNIGSIGFPFGLAILKNWERLSKQAKDFTESLEGQKRIQEFFANSVPVWQELEKLIGAVVKAIFEMGNVMTKGGANSQLAVFIRTLREDFLPWMVEFSTNATKVFGPLLGDLFKQMGLFLAVLSGENGPLALVIRVLTILLDLFNRLPGPLKTGIATALSWGGALKILGPLAMIFAVSLGTLAKAFGILFKVMLPVAKFLMRGGPWGMAIMAAVAIVIWMVTHWDQTKRMLLAIWDAIKAAGIKFWGWMKDAPRIAWEAIVAYFTTALGLLTALFNGLWETMKVAGELFWKAFLYGTPIGWFIQLVNYFSHNTLSKLAAPFKWLWNIMSNAVSATWDFGRGIGKRIVDGWRAIIGYFTGGGGAVLRVLATAFTKLWDIIVTGVSNVWNFAKGGASSIAGIVISGWNAVVDFFTKSPEKVFNKLIHGLGRLWTKIWDGAKNAWQSIFDTIMNFVNKIIDGMNWMITKIGMDKIPQVGVSSPSPKGPTIPDYAYGGIVKAAPGGVYRVAEAGHPEAIIPLDPSKRGRAWEVLNQVMSILSPPAFADGGIVRPVASAFNLVGFPGQGTHSFTSPPNNWQSDNALDFAVPSGTPIIAVANGTIGPNFGSLGTSGRFQGLRLTLDSGSNQFYYSHLSRYAAGIGPGASVQKGQVLGFSGSANGVEHLHFGVMNGNPMIYGSGDAAMIAAGSGGDMFGQMWGMFMDHLPKLPKVPEAAKGFGNILTGIAKFLLKSAKGALKGKVKGFFGAIRDHVGDIFDGPDPGTAPGEIGDLVRGQQNSWMGGVWGDPLNHRGFPGNPNRVAYAPTDRVLSPSALNLVLKAGLMYLGKYTPSNFAALRSRALQESGGHTGVVNQWDSNWSAGIPSIGLLQTIGPTFDTYKMPGYGNIWDPLHNTLAAVRYMYANYGHIVGASGRGYATGGEVTGGMLGAPVDATVHIGEWVLNQGQQNRVSAAMGITPSRLKRLLFESRGAINPGLGSSLSISGGSSSSATNVDQTFHIHTSTPSVDMAYIMRLAEGRMAARG